jgi:hypothetical protein
MYYGARYAWLRGRGLRWLFVVGHMRSGSSLLVHLLNSSPEILGYGETHIDYVGRRSLVDLHEDVRGQFEAHGEPPERDYRYVMDKILWPHIHNQELLRPGDLRVIVIVRSPDEALPSILSLDLEEIQTLQDALDYYVERLRRVREVLKVYDAPFTHVTYHGLTKQTEQVLSKISGYLALDEGLTPAYDTMWATGKSGIGDSSEHIEEGEVLSKSSARDVQIDSGVAARAREEYHRFLSFCRDHEHQPDGSPAS